MLRSLFLSLTSTLLLGSVALAAPLIKAAKAEIRKEVRADQRAFAALLRQALNKPSLRVNFVSNKDGSYRVDASLWEKGAQAGTAKTSKRTWSYIKEFNARVDKSGSVKLTSKEAAGRGWGPLFYTTTAAAPSPGALAR
jgi:hypothetical protein